MEADFSMTMKRKFHGMKELILILQINMIFRDFGLRTSNFRGLPMQVCRCQDSLKMLAVPRVKRVSLLLFELGGRDENNVSLSLNGEFNYLEETPVNPSC